jgi:uncharacterized protein (TIGR00255 family)
MNSMTGYGRSTLNLPDHVISIEVYSVNKKGLEIVFSAPKEWQAFEQPAITYLKQTLERGRVRVSLSVEPTNIEGKRSKLFNDEEIDRDLNDLEKFLKNKGNSLEITANLVLQLAQLRKRETGLPNLDEVMPDLTETLKNSTREMTVMRKKEGASVFQELKERTNRLEEMVRQMEEGSKEMANEWKVKLLERLNKANLSLASDDDRVLKEVALFAEKCDVSEEISRLRSHFEQILDTLTHSGSIGRKLEFLLQEVSRELNTFCSKSTRTQCTSIGLDARAEVEKMREQSMNVE